jgi:hypothetical protein
VRFLLKEGDEDVRKKKENKEQEFSLFSLRQVRTKKNERIITPSE